MASIKQTNPPSAAQIVWQWVCYGLWEWTLVALSTLLSAVLAYFFVSKDGDYQFVIYVLAAVICLLPLAFVVNRVYAKDEPEQKHGFAGVVMVLNAVLVFLATVAALITAVISTLTMAIHPPSDGRTITIISSLVVTVLGMMLFVRIINPAKLRKFSKLFPWIVVAVTGVTIILSFAGPFRNLMTTRDDRLIEDNIYTISNEIDNYANDHGKLPAGLNELQLDGSYQDGAKQLIDRNMVRYTPNIKPASTEELNDFNGAFSGGVQTSAAHYYQLCVTYEHQKGNGKNSTKDLYSASSNHSAGEVCYEQDTIIYKNN